MAAGPSTTISVNREAWERIQAWAEEAKKRNPKVYSPSNIVNNLMFEFLKQVTDDPELKHLQEATEKAAAETAKHKK